ncbi:MAG: trypsin-like peptidase domain-containing protein [Neomegalonema sp.]|nr:trypsin-like peptidase domain-containing protein [Neomegalonema sp.]
MVGQSDRDIAFLSRVVTGEPLTDFEFDAMRAERETGRAGASRTDATSAADASLTDAELLRRVSVEAEAVLVNFEVCDRRTYVRRYQSPTWPRGDAGIVIGVGYDLRDHSAEEIGRDWAELGPDAVALLQGGAGLGGSEAQSHLARSQALQTVVVAWELALRVLRGKSLLRCAQATRAAFPGADLLHPHCFGALACLVFDRGVAMAGASALPGDDRRDEMRAIRDLIQKGRVELVADQIRAMGRLWRGQKGLRGMLERREAEARLFEEGLQATRRENGPQLETAERAPSRVELAYEVALIVEATRLEQEKSGRSAKEIAALEPSQEMLDGARLEWGVSQMIRAGLTIIARLEARLRAFLCDQSSFDDLVAAKDIVGAPLKADRKRADVDKALKGKDRGHRVREILADALGGLVGFLPQSVCNKVVNQLFDRVFAPLINEVGELTHRHLCAIWAEARAEETPTTHISAAPAPSAPTAPASPTPLAPSATPVAPAPSAPTPAPSALALPEPIALSAAEPAIPSDPAPTAEKDAEAAAALLMRVLADDPAALASETQKRLLRAMGGEMQQTPRRTVRLLTKARDIANAAPLDEAALNEMLGETLEALSSPAETAPKSEILQTLKLFKRQKLFDQLAMVADRVIARDPDAESSYAELYAQGLIDSGKVQAALAYLTAVQARVDGPKAVASLIAMTGRAHKQIYVNSIVSAENAPRAAPRLKKHLEMAILAYAKAEQAFPEPAERHWPLINRIALLRLAELDRVGVSGEQPAYASLAHSLIDELKSELDAGPAADPWKLASLGEAYMAVGDFAAAARAFGRYAKQADRFMLSSTLRQLREVWRFQAGMAGAGAIIAHLKAALVARDGAVTLSLEERAGLAPGVAASEQPSFAHSFLETRTDKGVAENYFELYRIASCCRAICGLRAATGNPLQLAEGTGFLVDGPSLFETLSSDKSYILTNAHVLWDLTKGEMSLAPALTPDRAHITFDSQRVAGKEEVYKCAAVRWQSPWDVYDAALIELDRKVEGVEPLKFYEGRPQVSSPVAIIGHPRGGPLTIVRPGDLRSDHAKVVSVGAKTDQDKPIFVRYNITTEGGNSGSPVFETTNWTVVSLHHAGFGAHGLQRLGGGGGLVKANEGILMASVVEAIRASLAEEKAAATSSRGSSWLGRLRS